MGRRVVKGDPTAAVPIVFSNKSDHGRREANEDAFGLFQKAGRYLFVVADGMGGEAGGRIASSIVVSESRRTFEAEPGAPAPEILKRCVQAASDACSVQQAADAALASMGSTLELLLVAGPQAWIAHIGDSRIYRVSGHRAERITRDHTRVQQMLDDGFLTTEEAAEHPQRNVLSRVVGRAAECIPDISSSPLPFPEGDAFVLCSDGLTDVLSDDEIAAVVSDAHPEQACKQLVQLALAKNAADNVTVQVVYRGTPKPSWKRRRTLMTLGGAKAVSASGARRASLAIAILALTGGAFALGRWWERRAETPGVAARGTPLPGSSVSPLAGAPNESASSPSPVPVDSANPVESSEAPPAAEVALSPAPEQAADRAVVSPPPKKEKEHARATPSPSPSEKGRRRK